MQGTYAGIGSRETPQYIGRIFGCFGYVASRWGWLLRTGGADGADTWFEDGVMIAEGRSEVYLPWLGFNERSGTKRSDVTRPTPAAFELAAKHHPAWGRLSQGARALHARNGHIILGPDLNDPVDFVICWTRDGSLDGKGGRTGGTGQGLRIAAAYKVEVLNAKLPEHLEQIKAVAFSE